MSIKEIQERHEAMDDYVNEVADAESSFSDAESLFVETHRHRKELLDALKEIGELQRFDLHGDICGATIQIDDKGQYVGYYQLQAILDKV